ncbi:hypothetical protein DSAG12_00633 [Promethearchaeum syntrophicum]|uniref:Uncharacterized protein n=1 Tax=Promethearchaeum syntrophicum TaxID=2594042 RepID=A0A5B9D888_9ARCH|nr:hypothetical protein [Candidatus Prometheoarchaeum syntrophicum]QEE14816.1 hypothetical protein DSAG12_00633 [Candidatus Prometheoarchaeum syntrophicum]
MRKIHLVCPICQRNKRIKIPDKIFNKDEGSLLRLPIEKFEICPHQFIAVIDYNFSVRDYEIVDNDELFQYYLEKTHNQISNYDFSYF